MNWLTISDLTTYAKNSEKLVENVAWESTRVAVNEKKRK